MNLSELLIAAQWYFYLFLLGILFIPLTHRLFSKFSDGGYIFAKSIGIISLSYSMFLLGTIHLIPFTRLSLFALLALLFVVQLFFFRKLFLSFFKKYATYILIEELFFLCGFLLWTYVRGFAPEIHGLEKYMDFGFINSILRSEYFPPKDMWLTPKSINYYYFGHFITAVLTRLTDIPPRISYNLMLGSLVGLTFASAFSLAITLISYSGEFIKKHLFKLLSAGLLTAFLVTFAGNLHAIYVLFKPYENEKPVPFWKLEFSSPSLNPCYQTKTYEVAKEKKKEIITCSESDQEHFFLFPNSYWYPNATRFIHNTIHEFPIYSWVVADLHGHVFDIPLVILTISFAFSLFLKSQTVTLTNEKLNVESKRSKSLRTLLSKLTDYLQSINIGQLLFGSFLIAIMYMTNAWDGFIYLLFFALLFCVINFLKKPKLLLFERIINAVPSTVLHLGLLFLGFVIFALPFSIHFDPDSLVSGIGVICAPEFLTKLKQLGPFLFEPNHCQRSPLWQLMILYGFFYFFVISFFIFLAKVRKITLPDIFVLILIALSSLLIIIPEFFYLKDIYPDHYRANTMFKLVFQAFIMLSIVSGYVIIRLVSSIKYQVSSIPKLLLSTSFVIATLLLLCLVFIYPFQSTNSYYGNLAKYKGLDGLAYLKDSYPNDLSAIEWINKNITGQPVILEAQGDSYTDYARVSSNTGLPTVLGWTVHEWLWRGSYDVPAPRIAEIQTMYESEDINKTKELFKKYNVEYVFLGDLEQEKYTGLNDKKFGQLGKIVFQKGKTKVYKINEVK